VELLLDVSILLLVDLVDVVVVVVIVVDEAKAGTEEGDGVEGGEANPRSAALLDLKLLRQLGPGG